MKTRKQNVDSFKQIAYHLSKSNMNRSINNKWENAENGIQILYSKIYHILIWRIFHAFHWSLFLSELLIIIADFFFSLIKWVHFIGRICFSFTEWVAFSSFFFIYIYVKHIVDLLSFSSRCFATLPKTK